MTFDIDDRNALAELDDRLRTLLPEDYQDSYEDMQPVPMRSAGLKYDNEGRVAWDEIWGSFCDLAMAGGPPHKGMLLEPGTEAEIDAQYSRYDEVVDEICRGIRMVTGLRAYMSPAPGWVCVTCFGDGMAGWLVWKEIKRPVRAHLLARLTTSLGAVAALAVMALPVTYTSHSSAASAHTILLLTPGYTTGDLNRFKDLPRYTTHASIASGNITWIPDLPWFLARHPDIGTLQVAGWLRCLQKGSN